MSKIPDSMKGSVVTRGGGAMRLGATAITHSAMHLGEAVTIRGRAGLPIGL